MRTLSCTIILVLHSLILISQSPHGEEFKLDCALCHTSDNWIVNRLAIEFTHDSTEFKLIGQHQNVECRSCHEKLVFHDVGNDCSQCHSDIHNNTLGLECSRCHSPLTWKISQISEMHQRGRFELLGAHKNVKCAGCHLASDELIFEPLGVDCSNCHTVTFQQTKEPNHTERGFSLNCLECHSPDSKTWEAEDIKHEYFPLEGGHNIGCVDCHETGIFEKIPANCIECHQNTFNGAQAPNHMTAGIPNECESCHNIMAWTPSMFDHTTTGFELLGAHKNVGQCSQCHNGVIDAAESNCYSCHQVQYENATDHQKLNFAKECLNCHTNETWDNVTFDHSNTDFPLTGLHKNVTCSSCHSQGFSETSASCNSCHSKNYSNAKNPIHSNAGISIQCQNCHTTNGWVPSSFNHSSTGFELTGSHLSVEQCSQCHKGSTSNTSSDCISCHQVQYDTAPDHKQGDFPKECLTCHTTENWTSATFNHNNTGFPLFGKHIGVNCSSCHTNGYIGTSTECSSCHQDNYNSTASPIHGEAGISTSCNECHSPENWVPSSFNHTSTGFELTGGH